MNYAQHELFLINLRQQFADIFLVSKAGNGNYEQRLRAQGFIHTGELLEICSRQQALKLGDYDYFDGPALNRLR